MKIVRATVSDAADILAIQKEAFVPEAIISGSMDIPPLTQTLNDLIREFDDYDAFKAVVDNQIIGAVRGNVQEDTGHVSRLMVSLAYQNQGIGRQLMETLEGHFKSNDQVKRLTLFTGKQCQKSVSFYEKLGYNIYKEDHDMQAVALVFMEKYL